MAEKMTFEEALQRLDEIAEELNSGSPGLDHAMELYAEASKLLVFSGKKLDAAQGKIEKLLNPEDGVRKKAVEGEGSKDV